MKAEIKYNEEKKCIYVLITDSNRTLHDVEETGKYVASLQEKTQTRRIFYDHSNFQWKFDYLAEYSIAKNLDYLLPFEVGTKVAFFLGDFYNEKYWKLMQEIIEKNSYINLRYFGNREEAEKWLYND